MKSIFSLPVSILCYFISDLLLRFITNYMMYKTTRSDILLGEGAKLDYSSFSGKIDLLVQVGVIPAIVCFISIYYGSTLLNKWKIIYSIIVGMVFVYFSFLHSMFYLSDIYSTGIDIENYWVITALIGPIAGVGYLVYKYYSEGNDFTIGD